jgi:hypothetical protein
MENISAGLAFAMKSGQKRAILSLLSCNPASAALQW